MSRKATPNAKAHSINSKAEPALVVDARRLVWVKDKMNETGKDLGSLQDQLAKKQDFFASLVSEHKSLQERLQAEAYLVKPE